MANIIYPTGALRLLSSMYLCKPSGAAINGWTSLLADDASDLLHELKRTLEAIDAAREDTMEELLWDYTRLFIGPYKLPCPPWESVYTSHKKLMMQDAADDARRSYAQLGFAIDDPAVMPDHIGAELYFLSLVGEKASGKTGEDLDRIVAGERFLREHLLKWVPQFTGDMEEAADALLYKALARTTRNTLELLSS